MPRRRYYSSVSPKGQITLPSDVRHSLGIRPRDQVRIELEGDVIRISVARSGLLDHYQMAGSLDHPLDWKEVVEIAAEEHAEHAAREGID